MVFAPPGDTVTVEMHVDSEGESLIAVEVFLAYDADLFAPVDASSEDGLQVGVSAGQLSGVFADSVTDFSDSLTAVHYAELDLVGAAVTGLFASFEFVVTDWRSGDTSFEIVLDPGNDFRSQFAVPNFEGTTTDIPIPSPLVFKDTPPRIQMLDNLTVAEDHLFTVDLVPFGVDDQTDSTSLAWSASTSLADAVVEVADRILSVTPPSDFNGSIPLDLIVTDPAGATGTISALLDVTPENDPPMIDGSSYPDTLILVVSPISLVVSVTDVEDAPEDLAVAALQDAPLTTSIVGNAVNVSAPEGWTGTSSVTILVVDTGGATDSFRVPVIGSQIPLTPGDFDQNGSVDFADFLLFAQAFGTDTVVFDLDESGRVDFVDFLIFAANFGT